MSWDFIAVQGPFGGTSEGPAWDGESLLFTHIPESKIYRFNPRTSTTEVFRENTNCANGLMFDESIADPWLKQNRTNIASKMHQKVYQDFEKILFQCQALKLDHCNQQ
mgnify:CR=1 FL=1